MDTKPDNSERERQHNSAASDSGPGGSKLDREQSDKESQDPADTDKYLAMEQQGVTYTADTNAPLLNSDNIEDGVPDAHDLWDPEKPNNRNSEAFNQDEFMLDDNLELDDEKSKSISSDDSE